jgi:hypothetical protein
MSVANICPHCQKVNPIPNNVYLNVDQFGSRWLKTMTQCCGKPINVLIRKKLYVEEMTIGNFTEDDWGRHANDSN